MNSKLCLLPNTQATAARILNAKSDMGIECEDQRIDQILNSDTFRLILFLICFSRVIIPELLGKVGSLRDTELVVCVFFLNPNNISIKINFYFFRILQVSQNCVNHM